MPTTAQLQARREALVARSGLLRSALTLELRLIDARASVQGARALQWWRMARIAARVLRLGAWAVPVMQAMRAGGRSGRPLRRLARVALRLWPLLLRTLPTVLRRSR